MRGKQSLCRRFSAVNRITPAGAGKTHYWLCVCLVGWDHPRRCGENQHAVAFFAVERGSPPQVRGKRRDGTLLPASTGITPAGAGKTNSLIGCSLPSEDHPRRCGENKLSGKKLRMIPGSPPQVRGKPLSWVAIQIFSGITPAGAGKTPIFTCGNNGGKDHPRRCGENRRSVNLRTPLFGSPPQVRGKPHCRHTGGCCRGITPAGAGKTR